MYRVAGGQAAVSTWLPTADIQHRATELFTLGCLGCPVAGARKAAGHTGGSRSCASPGPSRGTARRGCGRCCGPVARRTCGRPDARRASPGLRGRLDDLHELSDLGCLADLHPELVEDRLQVAHERLLLFRRVPDVEHV